MSATPSPPEAQGPDGPAPEEVPEGPFEIRRRVSLYALLGLASLALAAGFGFLAWEREELLLWAPTGLFVLLALLVLPGVRDARTPLFVADAHGVRMREGDGWVGLLWSEMADIRVEPREGRLDPRVKVVSPDGQQIHTAPLGFTTTVSAGEAEVQLARRRGPAAH